jgi:hypothetical protein
MVEIRPHDDSERYKNSELANEAKDFLGQSKGKNVTPLGIEYDSYGRTYDLHDTWNIERDFGIAASFLNVFQTMAETQVIRPLFEQAANSTPLVSALSK